MNSPKISPVNYCTSCDEGKGFQKKQSRKWQYLLGSIAFIFFVSTIILVVILAKEIGVEKTEDPAGLPQWPPPSHSPMGVFRKAAVAADNVLCSDIGRDIMIRGGNAVDAGIAAIVCTGVMDAHSCGLGGGHFTTIYNSTTKTCLIIDAREAAPLAATVNMYQNKSSTDGWLAIGVPGEVAGLYKAHQIAGSMNWSSLLEPTISLLYNGYPVSPALAEAIEEKWAAILPESTMSLWRNPETGEGYKTGEIMRRPVLAKTLAQLAYAADPAGLFYNGSIADSVVAEFAKAGAIITKEDLRRYSAKVRQTVTATLANGLTVCAPPPPSSAAVTAAIFNIMAGYPFSAANLSTTAGNVAVYHKFIETMKFGYAQRFALGDSSFGPGNYSLAVNITTAAFAEDVRRRITGSAHPPSYYGGAPVGEDHGTAHIGTLDSQGNAMSTTTTINFYFGSKRRSDSTGIVWNNEMDDFSTPGKVNGFGFRPSAANFIYPEKRPLSSMSPLVIFNETDGKVRMVVGAAGGSRIISSVAYVALRTLVFNETVKEAVDARRLHDQLFPTTTVYGEGFPEEYIRGLRARGQNMTESAGGVVSCVVTAIAVDRNDSTVTANADFRKGETAGVAGY